MSNSELVQLAKVIGLYLGSITIFAVILTSLAKWLG